jgi:hypothetical protein
MTAFIDLDVVAGGVTDLDLVFGGVTLGVVVLLWAIERRWPTPKRKRDDDDDLWWWSIK